MRRLLVVTILTSLLLPISFAEEDEQVIGPVLLSKGKLSLREPKPGKEPRHSVTLNGTISTELMSALFDPSVHAVTVVVAGLGTLAWYVFDIPPPRLLLKYGLPQAGGPTGRTKTIDGMEFVVLAPPGLTGRTKTIAGMEFVEVAPGYSRVARQVWLERGDMLGRVCGPLGLPWGNLPRPHPGFTDEWIEVADRYWISRRPAPGQLLTRDPGSFRSPTREELWFAAVSDALHLWSLTEFEGHLLGPGWHQSSCHYSPIPGGKVFSWEEWRYPPLVWIPPEEE